ncbi:MAG: CDP-alcohol phosphatidyltransferase family protein [Dehalococcoidia bacterium]
MSAASIEGPVSRYLNRRLSQPLARLLAPTLITPNQVSLASLLVAFGALASFATNQVIVAGVLIQTSSVVDGVDGDLARLQGSASRFGAVFDAVLDRFADAAIVGGMAWWAWSHPGSAGPQPLVVGLAALSGFLVVSYSRARMEAEGYRHVLSGGALLASRDVRLLLAAIGSAVGQTYWTLVVLGGMSYLVLVWRLWLVYQSRPAAQAT